MDSTRTFWGMINNNLSTASITEHITQSGQGQSVDQYMQKQFGSQKASHSVIVLKQTGGRAESSSTVKSETINTPTTDYSRYLQVNSQQKTASGKPIDSSKILGVWAKTDNPNNQSSISQSYL